MNTASFYLEKAIAYDHGVKGSGEFANDFANWTPEELKKNEVSARATKGLENLEKTVKGDARSYYYNRDVKKTFSQRLRTLKSNKEHAIEQSKEYQVKADEMEAEIKEIEPKAKKEVSKVFKGRHKNKSEEKSSLRIQKLFADPKTKDTIIDMFFSIGLSTENIRLYRGGRRSSMNAELLLRLKVIPNSNEMKEIHKLIKDKKLTKKWDKEVAIRNYYSDRMKSIIGMVEKKIGFELDSRTNDYQNKNTMTFNLKFADELEEEEQMKQYNESDITNLFEEAPSDFFTKEHIEILMNKIRDEKTGTYKGLDFSVFGKDDQEGLKLYKKKTKQTTFNITGMSDADLLDRLTDEIEFLELDYRQMADNSSYTVGSYKELRARVKTAPYRGMSYIILAKKKQPKGKMNLGAYLKSLKVVRKKK